jgi:hypothetical protein
MKGCEETVGENSREEQKKTLHEGRERAAGPARELERCVSASRVGERVGAGGGGRRVRDTHCSERKRSVTPAYLGRHRGQLQTEKRKRP